MDEMIDKQLLNNEDAQLEIYSHRLLGLTIPLGPRVLFTRSPIAMAPTKDDCGENHISEGIAGYLLVSSDQSENNKPTRRAVSAFSSSAPCLKMLTGAIDKDACMERINQNHQHNPFY